MAHISWNKLTDKTGNDKFVASEYLSKGSPVLVEGRLKLDTWETSDGQKRSKLKVIGERMQMLSSRGGGQAGVRPASQRDEYDQTGSGEAEPSGPPDSEIPF